MRSDGFDEALYLAANPDLGQAFDAGLIESGRAHWDDLGAVETREGRRPTLVDVVAWPGHPTLEIDPDGVAARVASLDRFDAVSYLAMNPDLAAAFGSDLDAARRHWIQFGRLERRYGAGDAPYSQRRCGLEALLARPFGIDLYMPLSPLGAAGAAARRLLAALRAGDVPVAVRPYDERDGTVRVTRADSERGPAYRAALLVAAPTVFRKLLRLHGERHFDDTYVIAYWPHAALTAATPGYATFGGADEIWVSTEAAWRALAAVAPIPVRRVQATPFPLGDRRAARLRLGLPSDAYLIMGDAVLEDDDTGGLELPDWVEPAVDAVARANPAASGFRLVLRAEPRALAPLARLVPPGCAVTVLTDQPVAGGASLVLSACDALLATPSLDQELADARAGGVALIPPDALASAPAARPRARRGDQADAATSGRAIRALLGRLGLDAPQPPFATLFGRARSVALPPPAPHEAPLRAGAPVLSLLLDARHLDLAAIERLHAALGAQSYPHWELCLGNADPALLRVPRHRFAPDPRLRVGFGRDGDPVGVATGSYVLPVADAEAVRALAADLVAIAAAADRDPAPDILVVQEGPDPEPTARDTIEAGGAWPVAFRRGFWRAPRQGEGDDAPFAALLRGLESGARIGRCTAMIPAPPPENEERRRRSLLAHVRSRTPEAFLDAGLVAGTWRVRRHVPAGTRLHVLALEGVAPGAPGALNALSDAALAAEAEYLLLLDGRTTLADAATAQALLELLADPRIAIAGGMVLHVDGTLHQAGLRLAADGGLEAPGHGLPPESVSFARRVRNVDAVGCALAVRRSLLLELGAFDAELCAAEATFDMLAADLCLRVRASRALRCVYSPFARFVRETSDAGLDGEPRKAGEGPETPRAERLFRARWATLASG